MKVIMCLIAWTVAAILFAAGWKKIWSNVSTCTALLWLIVLEGALGVLVFDDAPLFSFVVCAILSVLWMQDLHCYYFSKSWLWLIAIAPLFMLVWPISLTESLLSLIYLPVCLFLYFRKLLGSADVWMMAISGLLLGIWPFNFCLFVALLCGSGMILKRRDLHTSIPFISCLSLGFLISWLVFFVANVRF